jgi:hypothetical protein
VVDKMKKQGQITIFVIIALLFVGAIILFFLVRTGKISVPGAFEEDPQRFIENCIEPKIKESINLLTSQGGNTNPRLYKTFKFSEDKVYKNISYLCYTPKNYITCVNQEPLLINHLEIEIFNYIHEEIENCFVSWENKMQALGYEVKMENLDFLVELEPGQVIVEADRIITANKKEESFSYDNFRVVIRNKIYDLAIVAQEILSQEGEYCSFSQQGFGLLYPEFRVEIFRTSDLNNIYTVTDKGSSEKFRFAVRGCVIPPGL